MNSRQALHELLRSIRGARAVLGILIDPQVNCGSCAPRAPHGSSLATLVQRLPHRLAAAAEHGRAVLGSLIDPQLNCGSCAPRAPHGSSLATLVQRLPHRLAAAAEHGRAVLGILFERETARVSRARVAVPAVNALICAAWLAAGSVAHAQERTWRAVDEMSDADKALFDARTATPRSSELPYIPAEPYPFEAPFTAEEMGYRSAEFVHISRWDYALVDVFGVVTGSGYINQGASVSYVETGGREGLAGYIHDLEAGEIYSKWTLHDIFPPENEGAQQLWMPYRTDKAFRTKMDFFVYSPQLRRVRRQPEPRRDQRFPDNSQTFDDVIGRDPWEFEWELLGTDVLYETVRFPSTRPTITLNVPGQGFVEKQSASFRPMGESFANYRSDGGVACWVVKATARPDWLPGYGEKYLVLWLEKDTFYPLRREKYGEDGRLIMIESRNAELQNPARGEFGYAALMTVYWNVDHDLIGYSNHDAHTLRDWTEEEQQMIFTAEFMRRQWLVEPLKTQAIIESPEKFFLRPRLYPDKFPDARNPSLPPAIAARHRAQEAAGKLVFETGDGAASP